MIRFTLVSSFLTVFTLSFVHVPVATADPIIWYASRRVQGYACPPTGCISGQYEESTTKSGTYVAHIDDAATDVNGSAAYTSDHESSISEFLIQATGSSSATATGAGASAYADTHLYVDFILDGDYNYDFSGALLASMGTAQAYLFAYTPGGFLHNHSTSNGPVTFSYSGTLGAGQYVLFFRNIGYAYSDTNPSTSGSFKGALSLTPAGVPDGGDTAMLFLLGSALLGAFARSQRRARRDSEAVI
jgi:hypothetical protein